ncbi:MAG: YbeF family protein [Clostridia bacterium]|nr:YbeF family protein [Clostridia bacterium]
MNILLIFFALPIATIIISIALQKIFKCPPLVAAVIFAIFLVVVFAINNINFLVATIIYTIISFITASIVCLINRLMERFCQNSNSSGCRNSCNTTRNYNRSRTGQICGCYRRR